MLNTLEVFPLSLLNLIKAVWPLEKQNDFKNRLQKSRDITLKMSSEPHVVLLTSLLFYFQGSVITKHLQLLGNRIQSGVLFQNVFVENILNENITEEQNILEAVRDVKIQVLGLLSEFWCHRSFGILSYIVYFRRHT